MWFTCSSLVDVQDVKLALIQALTSGLSLQNKQSRFYYVFVGLTASKNGSNCSEFNLSYRFGKLYIIIDLSPSFKHNWSIFLKVPGVWARGSPAHEGFFIASYSIFNTDLCGLFKHRVHKIGSLL